MADTVGLLRDAINSHDPARVAGCFTDDYACEVPMHPSRSFTGSEQVLRNWTGILGTFPDLRAEVLRTATSGDETWSEWEMTGTGADGTPGLFRGVVVWTATGDRIAWSRFYLDPVLDA